MDLSSHCIQAEARRQYNHQLSICLKTFGQDNAAEKKLELLKTALETWNFSKLRAENKALCGGSAHEVFLAGDDAGKCFLLLDDTVIETG